MGFLQVGPIQPTYCLSDFDVGSGCRILVSVIVRWCRVFTVRLFVILSMQLWLCIVRAEAIRGWRGWLTGGSSCSSLQVASGLGWLPPAPFLQCKPHPTPAGFGVLADPARIDEEFRKALLRYFCRSGQRDTSLEEFSF